MPYLYETDRVIIELPQKHNDIDAILYGLDYQAETDKTASNTFTPQNVGVIEFTECLSAVIHAAERMNHFKKALFRKRSREEAGLEELPAIDIDLLRAFGRGNADAGVALAAEYDDLFHGIVGVITETGELAEILLHLLDRDTPPDKINVMEETGDQLWYLSRLTRYTQTSFLQTMQANIAKLRKRHGEGGFDKEGDGTRDLAAERAVLSGETVGTVTGDPHSEDDKPSE